MSKIKNKKPYKRIALVLSMILIIVWVILGTSASLAWFTDTSPKTENIFHFADFDIDVSYRQDDGTYKSIDGQTEVFDDEALYEPGYVQVVYLRIKNNSSVPINFKTAVNVTNYTLATNVFGGSFNLQDYLTFGLVTANTENALNEKVANRELAKNIATVKLNNYSTDSAPLDTGETTYMALIVHMPEEVGNEANYCGTTIPKVELGLIVNATQQQ